jgi:hypothetical protein
MLYGAIILGIGKLGPLLIERVMKSKMSVVEYSVAGTALLAVMLVIGIKTKDLAKPQSLPLFGVLMVYAWTGLSVFNVGIAGGVFVAAVIVLLQLSMSATSFGMNELLKKDEKYRATILSYRGGMDRLVGVGAWLIIGHIGIGDGSLILASFLLIIVVLIMKKG